MVGCALCVSLLLPAPVWAQSKSTTDKKRPVATASKSIKKPIKKTVSKKSSPAAAKASAKRLNVAQASVAPLRASHGQLAGLHTAADPLDLHSSVALVIDQDTREVLFRKNDNAVLPIASLTKLMTGLVISEAQLPMSEMITITQADVDTEKGSSSRLAVGTVLSRGDLLHLSLMSSENRAAHALGRSFPGGLDQFVKRMNLRAQALGMSDTRYVEPTGLSSRNQSSANDLAVLVAAAYKEPVLRELSTSHGREIEVGRRTLQYNNTNRLVKSANWDIGLQKTGYISEAGQCLVMQARVSGRKLIMVFLDSAGKLSRIADAERVRRWVEKSAGHSATRHSALTEHQPG
ncbi:serine hydrolase [Limnohabitans sp. DCL3]|uniref:serine hydrolase n=1 Tax=Limnohabitans sp. DCL3 TaxID=3374103 RepID=UPI003A837238